MTTIFVSNVAAVAAFTHYGYDFNSVKCNAEGRALFLYDHSVGLVKAQQKFALGKLKISDAKWYSLEISKMRTFVRGADVRGPNKAIKENPTSAEMIIKTETSATPKKRSISDWNPFEDLSLKLKTKK